MKTFPLTNRGLTLTAIVTLALLTALAVLIAGASAVSAQGTVPDAPDQPSGTAVFIGGVDLEWNEVRGADSYGVQMYRNGQWTDLPADGIEIAFYGAGAIISELEPDGSSYWFRIRAGSAHGFSEWSDFNFMAPTSQSKSGRGARPDNVPASGTPFITGTAQVGESLAADTSGIEDSNGLDRVQFRFQWVSHDGSADTDIANATDSTYNVAATDVGKTIKVRVAFTDRGGYAESLTGGETATVAAGSNSPATGEPTISGTAQVGETLTADTSGIADADGLTNVSYSYQWVANDGTADTDIAGATYFTYRVAVTNLGKTIKVQVSFADDAGNQETRSSVATPAVEVSPNIEPAGVPIIGGMTEVGQELSSSTFGIGDRNGVIYAHFSYQWVRSDGTTDVDISDANSTSYWLTDADEGKTIKVRVSYVDDGGNPESVTSEATTRVAARPDTSELSAPTALTSGLSANGGGIDLSWTAPEGTVTGYQILRVEIPTRVNWWEPLPHGCKSFYVIHADDTGSDATTYTDTEVSDGASYGYRVRAINSDGVGQTSRATALQFRPDSRWPSGPPGSPVGAPSNLASTTIHGGIGLTWDAHPEELTPFQRGAVTGYQILRRLPEQCEFGYSRVHVANTGSTVTRWADRDVIPGTLYEYHVRSVNDAGAGYLDATISTSFRLTTLTVSAEPNTAPTGAPIITGTAQVGETLTADGSGIGDVDGLYWAKVAYQWLADGADIAGANATTYTLTADDEGSAVKVRVSFTDDAGNEEELTSAATDTVAFAVQQQVANSPATGAPTISGTAQVGVTLTADISGIADADGLTNVSYSYQWVANDGTSGTDIAGATDSTYTLVVADEGKTIKVRASFTDDVGNWETLTSAATDAVSFATQQQTFNSPATGAPTISGTAQVGETLTADTTGIADADGLSGPTFSYQWVANDGTSDTDIADATDSTYTLAADDEAKTIKVRVSFTDDAGNEEELTSAATDTVEARPNSPATGLPTISGTARVGETLTADTSGIADADGLTNATFTYQWLADDSDISGATNATYTLTDSEESKAITVQVSFTDDADNEETLTSAATDAVAGAQPTEPPAKPRNLSATASHDSVTLTWDDPGDDSITGYVILRRNRATTAPGEFTELVDDTGSAATTYTDGSVSAETLYTYRIKAINDHGLSELSRWVRADTPSPPVPAKPTGLTATASHDQVVLSWDDPQDDTITGYVILRRNRATTAPGEFTELVADTGSAANTYTDDSVAADTSYTYKIRAINEHGVSELSRWARADTPAPSPANSPATGAPTIAGTAQVGETLTADTSGIADGDGLTNVAYSYQWLADDADIAGATDSSYTLVDADEGAIIKLRVSFTDDAGNEETMTSAATEPVGFAVQQQIVNTPATGQPTISGMAQVGETLTADTSGISDVDGLSSVSYSYQWLADGAEIAGATATVYTLTDSEEGKTVKVRVSFTDDAGNEEELTSAATDTVEARPNSPATGQPTISGTAQVGETLTADTLGISDQDGLSSASYNYQWLADDGNSVTGIAGATDSTYTVAAVDEGSTIQVMVSFTDDAGNDEELTSAATDTVEARPNSPATGWPTITGTAQVGETLTADTSGIADQDGLTNVAYSYQWLADDADIAGATDSSYTPTDGDEGAIIKLRVSFTDDAGNEETMTSAATDAVAAVQQQIVNTPATGQPTISGMAQVGETLTADTSGISDVDGLSSVSYSYQWLADDADIAGATATTYTLTDSEQGKTVKVRVSFTDDAGNDESLTSAATGTVEARPNSPATGAPVIVGTARVGETLTADTSGIADADGLSGAVYRYEWIVSDGGADLVVPGAKASTYTVLAIDRMLVIKVRVHVTDDRGHVETLTSAPTAVVR